MPAWILLHGVNPPVVCPVGIQSARFEDVAAGIGFDHYQLIRIRPEEFYKVRRIPEEMSTSELRSYILNLRAAGLPYITHQVNIYQKVSTAVISFIFTVIALPIAFLIPIRGGVPLGLGLSILLVLIFWSLFSLALTLGYTGIISPPLAAWSAQALALVLGLTALALIKHPRLH